jgi:hypothetical protein
VLGVVDEQGGVRIEGAAEAVEGDPLVEGIQFDQGLRVVELPEVETTAGVVEGPSSPF